LFATLLALSACGKAQIVSPDGSVETRLFIGPASLPGFTGEFAPKSVSLTSLGAWGGPDGGGIGYQHSQNVCLHPDCHVVIFAEGDSAAESWRRMLEGIDGVCVIE